MTTMIQLAKKLANMYTLKVGAEIAAEDQQTEYDDRLLSITPDAGWPGKNEQERKTAAGKAEAADDILAKMRGLLSEHRAHITDYSAEIAGLEAERRALEWQVRADMVKAIGGRLGHADNGHAEQHGAPDDALETLVMDEYTFALAASEPPADTVPWADCAAEMRAGMSKPALPDIESAYTEELDF